MAVRQRKKRLFSGMGYRQVQRSNCDRKSKLSKNQQTLLKQQGYKNIGWDHVIKLYQKINALTAATNAEEDTLEDLFLKADRIGNKYQTPKEIAAFNQQLSAEIAKVADTIDQQFPETAMEIMDYSTQSQRSKKQRKP